MHLMARVVFMGSPDFAVPTLRSLAAQQDVRGVVTQPDRPAGRGRGLKAPAVKRVAIEMGLPAIQPARLREPEAMATLRLWAPEVIVVAAFGQILRSDVLGLPTHGCLNVHASLLPRWRGAAPIQAAILAGDPETGVTIMKMDEGVDTGGILSQGRTPIAPGDTAESLSKRLSQLGAELLTETLPRYLAGELQPRPQDEARATKAPMLKKQDGLLDPNRSAAELERRVRALNPWPGAFFTWGKRTLKVLRAHTVSASSSSGKRLVYEGGIALGTTQGILVLDEVQVEGRKPMSGDQFLVGARNWVGSG
jgi:methionyl-tRNA formyltransferase